MISPKQSKHLTSTPPVSNSARFRSPGIMRKNLIGDPGFQSAQLAKKSRRSKSSDTNGHVVSSNSIAGTRKLSKPHETVMEEHLEALNNRWRMMAKNQEKMTKDEIMNDYKLLLTDHIKLEKFMALVTRENELNRTRLESDLLDSMMLVEDLKQSLEAGNINRRSRLDPRDSDERREIMKQNKKLLNELHEITKKNEKLELLTFELKEQVELADFQMMEVQNQKIMMEEQQEARVYSHATHCQTTDVSDEYTIEMLTRQKEAISNDYNTICDEHKQMMTDMKSILDENEVLKISEENLQEEVVIKTNEIKSLKKDIKVLEDKIKKSLEIVLPRIEPIHVKGPRSIDDETIVSASDDFDELSTASDSGFEMMNNSYYDVKGRDLLADSVKMLWPMLKDKDDEIVRLKNAIKAFDETPNLIKNNDESCDPLSTSGSCCSSLCKLQLLEKENRRWKSFVENIGKTDNELLRVIADLEAADCTHTTGIQKSVDRSAANFRHRQEEIQCDHNRELMASLLTNAENVRDNTTRELLKLQEELDTSNLNLEKLDAEKATLKQIEVTLRQRIETLEQRLMNIVTGPTKSSLELETKVAQLETVNSSLVERETLDKQRIHEQRKRIINLEHENRTLNEKCTVLQTKELCAQKKINRLQGVYEDLLREYASLRVPNNDSQNIITEENKRLTVQLKQLHQKCDDLQSLIIRYQRHVFSDGKLSNNKVAIPLLTQSFNSNSRDLGT